MCFQYFGKRDALNMVQGSINFLWVMQLDEFSTPESEANLNFSNFVPKKFTEFTNLYYSNPLNGRWALLGTWTACGGVKSGVLKTFLALEMYLVSKTCCDTERGEQQWLVPWNTQL